MKKHSLVFILFIPIFLLGVLASPIVINWTTIKSNFFQVRLIEIIQVVVALTIACVITFIVTTRVSYNAKKREMLLGLLDSFQENLTKLLEAVNV